MILHPGILALLSGSLICLMIMLYAALLGVRILLFWNPSSSGERQLQLERRTWLVGTLVNFALVYQIISAGLYVFTAEDLHQLFVGAMCATGTLNANLIGWLVLVLKGGLLFGAFFWVVFNRLDQRTEETPLVRSKYLALLFLTPLVALDFYLQWRFFSGLDPQIITSCCGSLFTAQGEGVAADLAGLPPGQAMVLFFTFCGFYLLVLLAHLWRPQALLRIALFVVALLFFFVSLAAVISFISPYIYQLPSHHCPFDMLQGHYNYIGYPLYAGLLVATLYGMLPGMGQLVRRHAALVPELDRLERRWLVMALSGLLVFLGIVCWPILFSSFRLFY